MKINQILINQNQNIKKNESEINKLMIKIGLIEKLSSGIYIWLPLGVLILNKIKKIISNIMLKNDFTEIDLPILQPYDIWEQSGRLSQYGNILMKTKFIKNNYIFSPTNEEVAIILIKKIINSHRELPKKFFQIQKKFRNEERTRSGIIRAKEFIMKDAYSFHINKTCLNITYNLIYQIYKKIFNMLKIKFFIIKTSNNEIGGNISHEFHVISKFGEQKILKINKLININFLKKNNILIVNLTQLIYIQNCFFKKKKFLVSPYLIIHIPYFIIIKTKYKKKNSMEIAHIFKIGQKYSKKFNVNFYFDKNIHFVEMGCYGIGITRLLASIVENNIYNENILWPNIIAPFKIAIILNNKNKDNYINCLTNKILNKLKIYRIETLLEDRNINIKEKFNIVNNIGIKKIILIDKNSTINKIKFINTQFNIIKITKFNILLDFFIR